MNTTWNRRHLLGQFGRAALILHHGLALVGLVAVLLVIARGKALFFDEQPNRSATIGAIHYDGAASLFDGADEADGQKYRALAAYVSRRYRIVELRSFSRLFSGWCIPTWWPKYVSGDSPKKGPITHGM